MSDEPKRADAAVSDSLEVVLHEVGELLTAGAVSMQRELQRYSNTDAGLQLGELELELPAKVRVDELGQLRVNIVAQVGERDAIARLRFRVTQATIRATARPNASLNLSQYPDLTDEQRQLLEKYRIFSGEDLSRAARNASGYQALCDLLDQKSLDQALAIAELTAMPGVPADVSLALIRIGIRSVAEFQRIAAADLANKLSSVMNVTVSEEVIAEMQRRVNDSLFPLS